LIRLKAFCLEPFMFRRGKCPGADPWADGDESPMIGFDKIDGYDFGRRKYDAAPEGVKGRMPATVPSAPPFLIRLQAFCLEPFYVP
jgi:hypothetical protein